MCFKKLFGHYWICERTTYNLVILWFIGHNIVLFLINKGIGKVFTQAYIDTYLRVSDVKLYTEKTAITSADMLNDRVLPWYEEQGIPVLRIMADRGTEFKGTLETHAFELF